MVFPSVRANVLPDSSVFSSPYIIESFTVPPAAQVGDLIFICGIGSTFAGSPNPPAEPQGTPYLNGVSFNGDGYFQTVPYGTTAVTYFHRLVAADLGQSFQIYWTAAYGAVNAFLILANTGGLTDQNTEYGGNNFASFPPVTLTGPTLTTTQNNELIAEVWGIAEASGYPPGAQGSWTTLPNTISAPSRSNNPHPGTVTGQSYTVAITTLTAAVSGAVATSSATFTDAGNATGGGTGPAFLRFGFTLPAAPLAPTLLLPANASYIDLTQAQILDWGVNPSDGGSTQSGYALRIKTSGGSYQYWNAGTSALQGTIIWNTSTTSQITLPGGTLSNGTTYNWSVATVDAFTSLQGSFATDGTFSGRAAPAVTVTGPTGVQQTFIPTIGWAATYPSGAAQTGYQAKIFTAAQYGIGGFNPATSPVTYDTGAQSSTATSIAVPLNVLANNTTYRVYVQLTETGGVVNSTWAYASFSVAVDAPNTPAMAVVAGVDPVTGAPCIFVSAEGEDNLLSANAASMETDATGWTAGGSTTLAVSSTHALDGAQSMKMTASSSGSPSMTQSGGHILATVGKTYTASLVCYPNSTTRTVQVKINWLNSGGGTISSVTGSVTETAATWKLAFVAGTAPAGTTQMDVVCTVVSASSGESHFLDEIGLFPGSPGSWGRGGLVGITAMEIQSSADGVTWTDIRGGAAVALVSPDQLAALTDYESLPATPTWYRAQVSATTTGFTIISTWSTAVSAATAPGSYWWLKDPLIPSAALKGNVNTNVVMAQPEKIATKIVMGSPRVIVVTDGLLGHEGVLTMGDVDPNYTALKDLIQTLDTILIQSPFGEQWYVRFGALNASASNRQSTRQFDSLLYGYGVVTAPFVETLVP